MGKEKLSTEEILKEIESGNIVDSEAVDFVERTEQLNQLSRKIIEEYGSFSKFAIACEMSPSHLNEFLNGKKQLSRNKLISICITLRYDIKTARQILRSLGDSDLYSRKRRDFEILNCIRQGKSLDETNEILMESGFDILDDRRSNP